MKVDTRNEVERLLEVLRLKMPISLNLMQFTEMWQAAGVATCLQHTLLHSTKITLNEELRNSLLFAKNFYRH
jgi:hypothetical protein